MAQHIIDATQALTGLLRDADEAGVPMPRSAEVSEWGPFQHPVAGRGGIELHVETIENLTAWSTWLDMPIENTGRHYRGGVTVRVFAMADMTPVKVWCRIPVAAEVSA